MFSAAVKTLIDLKVFHYLTVKRKVGIFETVATLSENKRTVFSVPMAVDTHLGAVE